MVIAGAGPTGMMLSAELMLAGVDVAIVERRAGPELEGTRARGLLARTIEVLDQRGVVDRFLTAGYTAQVHSFALTRLDISDFPTRHPYGLALEQSHFERILGGWIEELGVPIYREREVTGFTQDGAGADVAVSDGETLRAQFLIGCDGGRSLVRKAAGIDFPGWDPSVSSLIAQVQMRDEPPMGIRRDERGQHAMARLEDGKLIGVVTSEPYSGQTGEPTLQELSRMLIAAYGTDFGAHSPKLISRFTDMTRQAASYRNGRVLLAGDAAHIHYPVGGQGLNIGVQDAVNLGWKLAQVVKGTSPESLLDTYQAERHPVAARVLRDTMAATSLIRSDARIDALREAVGEMLSIDVARKQFGAIASGLGIHYDLGEGHPLLGRRMPDLDLVTNDGPVRVFTLLHEARPVLLNLGAHGSIDINGWTDRVRLVEARYDGDWELPALGTVNSPSAVLIRPDGYVAWVGERTSAGLSEVLTTWFGQRLLSKSPEDVVARTTSGCRSTRARPGRPDFRSS